MNRVPPLRQPAAAPSRRAAARAEIATIDDLAARCAEVNAATIRLARHLSVRRNQLLAQALAEMQTKERTGKS